MKNAITEALDSRGTILHKVNGALDWNDICEMRKDLELQMLGMVEIRVTYPSGNEKYYPSQYSNPLYLYPKNYRPHAHCLLPEKSL